MGEPSIVAFREAVAQRHAGLISAEQPPKGEHQSNGQVESAGNIVRDLVRVLRLQLGHHLKIDLSPNGIIMEWMVRWAAMITSRYQRGRDGKTPYFRQKGNTCNIVVIPFAEKIWFRKARGEGGR